MLQCLNFFSPSSAFEIAQRKTQRKEKKSFQISTGQAYTLTSGAQRMVETPPLQQKAEQNG